MTLIENQVNSNDFQWGGRPVRLQERFLVLRKLGQGTYGKVQLALNKETNQEVAIKTIKKARIESEEDMLRIRREIQIMASIRHPHIIHINEVFETRQKIVIVMQYASGGELYDYLGCHQKLPEIEARRIFRQIASAIYYCHKNRICHRDLKLENILLDEEGNAQIADFGLSNIFDDRRRMSTFCGSPLYASPEIVKGTPYKGPEVDCWSLGVLLYTLIYGTMPFDGRHFKELVSQISAGKYEEPINKSDASTLIRSLLTPEISKRATISDVCKDKWVNDGYKDSLLKLADQMALENHLNGENLIATQLCLENYTKNGLCKNSLAKTNNFTEPKNGKLNLRSVLKNCVGHNEVNRGVSDKPTLYEQILSYDVRFVINKLLTAVESSLTVLNGNNNTKFQPPVKEKPSLNAWTKNGDTTTASKVDSAYVIPIFEVTSIVPKSSSKNIPFCFNKMNTRQFLGTQNDAPDVNCETSSLISHKKVTKVKIKKKDEEHKNETSTLPKIKISCEIQDANKTHSTTESELAIANMPPKIINDQMRCPDNQNKTIINHKDKLGNFEEECKLIVNQENIPHRIPSPKTKRKDESIFHNKLSPFFRTRNHALSLAHLFSLNFEKFNLNSLKVPERRQKKSPGKITIPATFDPTTAPCIISERKEILLFPTISVSENKEKIEKKIEKIKKAALNMKLIRRSNSKNRLKIQKYLKSQAKKIQDLVSDEQRSKNNSIEKIRKCETFSAISDAHFGVRYFNSINIRQQNKKINFLSPNSCFGEASSKWNLRSDQSTRWNLSVSGNNTQDMEYNFNLFNLSKSKSDEMKVQNTYPAYSISHEDIRRCILDTDLSDFGMKNLSQYSKLFRSKNNYSSELSMKNEHDQRMTETKMPEFCTNIKLSSNEPQNLPSVPSNSSQSNQNCCHEKVSNLQSHDGIVPSNLQNTSSEANNLNHISHIDSDCLSIGYEIKASLSECTQNSSWAGSKIENPSQNGTRMKRLSSEPSLGNLRYKHSNSSCELSEHRVFSPDNMKTNLSTKGENKKETNKKSGLSRRNTFGCLTDFTSNNKHIFRKEESRRNMSVKRDDFQDYLFMMYVNKKLQQFNSQNNLEFLNHPDLCNFHQDRNLMHLDSKSVHEISRKLYEASLSDTPVYGLNEAKSAFLRKLLQNPDSIHVNRFHTGTRASRIKSVSEEVLTHNENADYLRKTQSERKLSLPQGLPMDQNETRKIPFLSNFLNELEKREPLKGIKDKPFTRRQYSLNTLGHDKKLRKENRSKSFLQLLSLKRIQEAEKELDRIERPDSLEKEDENSGSLLEALKTHGYKNVISQRFQVEDNSNDLISFRHPINSYFSRTPDIPRTYLSNYDNILHNGTSTYDYSEYDELDGFASPFQLETNCNPRFPKQYVQDWLTTNLNEKYMDSTRMERNGHITPEKQIQTMSAVDKRCMWEKESSKSYEDDPSSSESFEFTKDIYSNGMLSNDFGRVNDDLLNHSNASGYSNIERNHLLRTSSISEDEKEESVQDRIWRKSFYSRFNNSALSRKDKSKFVDSDLLLEKSGLVNGNSRLLSSPRERADSLQWNTVYKNSSLKRAATLKPSLSKKNSFDSSSINSLKLRSKSFRHSLSEEAPQVRKDATDEKNLTEPEH